MVKVYLGDAVYAEWQGQMLKLTTSDGVMDTNTIYLEDFVIEALQVFLRPKEKEPQQCNHCDHIHLYPDRCGEHMSPLPGEISGEGSCPCEEK